MVTVTAMTAGAESLGAHLTCIISDGGLHDSNSKSKGGAVELQLPCDDAHSGVGTS
jgi:hypothetical protein